MRIKSFLLMVGMVGMAFLSTSCGVYNYKVASDYNFKHPYILDRYKSFAWASQADDLQNCTYFLNDPSLKTSVKHAISRELSSLGYMYSSRQPDLLINFRVFEKPVKIARLTDWGENYWSQGELLHYDESETFNMPRGSVVVQIIDRRIGKIVWQGYVSGLTSQGSFAKDKDNVDLAVSFIFRQYPFDEETLSYIGQIREMLLF
jgi:hypothetical protein